MHKLCLSLVGLAVVCTGAFAQKVLAGSEFGTRMGVNAHGLDFPGEHYDLIKNAGMGWIRRDLNWGAVEPLPGVWNWSAYDKILTDATTRGIRLNFILGYGNKNYSPNAPNTPELRSRFMEYVRRAVSRYQGRGIVWEIWNEPNHPDFWAPAPNQDDYFALANEVSQYINTTHPREYICLGGTAGIDRDWLDPLFQRGILRFIDAVAVHPYRGWKPETALNEYTMLRFKVDKHRGRRNIDLINSEWGYPVGVWELDSYKQQTYTSRMYLVAQMAGLALNLYFSWKDLEDYHGDHVGTMGMLTKQNEIKPSYNIQKFLAERLNGFRLVTRLRNTNVNDVILLYTDGSKQKLVVYTEDNLTRQVNLSLNSGKVKAYTPDGTITEYTFGSMGSFLPVNGYPTVIEPASTMSVLNYAAMTGGMPLAAMVADTAGAVRLMGATLQMAKSTAFAPNVDVQLIDEPTGATPYRKEVHYFTKSTLPPLDDRGALNKFFAKFPFVIDPNPTPRKVTLVISMGIHGKFTQQVMVYKPSAVN